MKENAYQMEFSDLLDKLQTSENWISVTEAKIRNKLYGQNVILSKDNNSALKILLNPIIKLAPYIYLLMYVF